MGKFVMLNFMLHYLQAQSDLWANSIAADRGPLIARLELLATAHRRARARGNYIFIISLVA